VIIEYLLKILQKTQLAKNIQLKLKTIQNH